MTAAIIGYATEGEVSARYFAAKGYDITVCDRRTDLDIPEAYACQLGEDYLRGLDGFDVVVRTAGLNPSLILAENPGIGARITTAVDTFLADCPTKNIIGITGTKGKGTTSTLTAKMLEASGKRVFLGGNIGRSPLEFIGGLTADDWAVLELSSFQLCDVTHSPHIAVCLMVVPEHLNWHTDMDDYIAAKSRLFAEQTAADIAVYYAANDISKRIAANGNGQKVAYYTPPGAHIDGGSIVIDGHDICKTSEFKLLGEHNWQNVCAAVTAVWQAGVHDTAVVRSVLTTFSGLEHRLEFVREVAGVRYYDDSFGTTPETAIVALEAFSEPKVIVLGGSDKGAGYDELARTVARSRVRHAVLIGDEAEKIRAALDKVGFSDYTVGLTGMPAMVRRLQDTAKPGDVALLSTGCASFGLFKDYKDRARQFVKAVRSLAS